MFPNKQLTVPMPGMELESVDMVGEWEWDSGTTTIGYSKAVVRAGRVGRRVCASSELALANLLAWGANREQHK